ncbi:hypothetical protein MP638_001414 [Amoeboaphelidium occidentale]|nr:hypothetical protein MP638_001414 [Amoeboaphelidium occidentale]
MSVVRIPNESIKICTTQHLPLPSEEDVSLLTEESINLLRKPYNVARSPLFAIPAGSAHTSIDIEEKYPNLPNRKPSVLLYARNLYDVSYGLKNGFSVIHIHPDCEPLKQQAIIVTKSLRKFETAGIISSLSALLLQGFNFQSHKPLRNYVLGSILIGCIGVASYCTFNHWRISRRSTWAASGDYVVYASKTTSQVFLVKADMFDVETSRKKNIPALCFVGRLLELLRFDLWNGSQSHLYFSMYTFTFGAWASIIRSMYYGRLHFSK